MISRSVSIVVSVLTGLPMTFLYRRIRVGCAISCVRCSKGVTMAGLAMTRTFLKISDDR